MSEKKSLLRRIFRRSIWENASTVLILVGVFMLMQPFAMWMYTYSFYHQEEAYHVPAPYSDQKRRFPDKQGFLGSSSFSCPW